MWEGPAHWSWCPSWAVLLGVKRTLSKSQRSKPGIHGPLWSVLPFLPQLSSVMEYEPRAVKWNTPPHTHTSCFCKRCLIWAIESKLRQKLVPEVEYCCNSPDSGTLGGWWKCLELGAGKAFAQSLMSCCRNSEDLNTDAVFQEEAKSIKTVCWDYWLRICGSEAFALLG